MCTESPSHYLDSRVSVLKNSVKGREIAQWRTVLVIVIGYASLKIDILDVDLAYVAPVAASP